MSGYEPEKQTDQNDEANLEREDKGNIQYNLIHEEDIILDGERVSNQEKNLRIYRKISICLKDLITTLGHDEMYIKVSILETPVVMCQIVFEKLPQIRYTSQIKDRTAKEDYIMDIIGSVLGRIIAVSETIEEQRKLYENEKMIKKWNDERKGRIWIKGTFLENAIKKIITTMNQDKDSELIEKYKRYVEQELARFYNLSPSELPSYFDAGIINEIDMRFILKSHIMRTIFLYALKGFDENPLKRNFLFLANDDMPKGIKGEPTTYFFDGAGTIEAEGFKPWLEKNSFYFHFKLKDANADANVQRIADTCRVTNVDKCVFFQPIGQTIGAAEKESDMFQSINRNIHIFYSKDMCEIIKILNPEDDRSREIVLDYIRKRIRL